jgi:hypothetical protein
VPSGLILPSPVPLYALYTSLTAAFITFYQQLMVVCALETSSRKAIPVSGKCNVFDSPEFKSYFLNLLSVLEQVFF